LVLLLFGVDKMKKYVLLETRILGEYNELSEAEEDLEYSQLEEEWFYRIIKSEELVKYGYGELNEKRE